MNLLHTVTTLPFAYPAVLLVPVLAAAAALFVRAPTRPAAVFPSSEVLAALPRTWRLRLRGPVLGALFGGCVVCLTIAAARPQKVSIFADAREHRSLILALDISRSMATPDFGGALGLGRVSRLDAVKAVVRRFVDERRDDRLGLVVFGTSAFVQAPLTRDHSVVSELVGRLQVGMAGDGTAIGDGLGLSLKRIADIPAPAKAVVLLTDGVSNSGQVNPLKAAHVAAELGVKVYTIGIGAAENSIRRDPNGVVVNRPGATAEFDEETLKEIARLTGGAYLNASTIEGLHEVYAEIDRLEGSTSAEPEHRVVEELFPAFINAALVFFSLFTAFSRTVFRRLP